MFARTLNVLISGVALVVGTACKGPDSSGPPSFDYYSAVAWGANVIPAATDTAPRAEVNFNFFTFSFAYDVVAAPSGTIDSIAFYQVLARDTLPTSATAIICAGVAACASQSGIATLVPPATATTEPRSARTAPRSCSLRRRLKRLPAALCAGRCMPQPRR